MARTISEIYNEMVAEKESMSSLSDLQPNIDDSQTLLSDLTSTSKVAVWRLLLWIVAFGIWTHEVIFDAHKAEIKARAKELITGTRLWYRDQSLIYQHGDALVWNGQKYLYEFPDESKQIIKRCAVIEGGGQVRIKVAKVVSDEPAKLDASEESAFSAYTEKIKFAGTNILIISEDADLLRIYMSIKRDPLVLNADGSLISDGATFPVNDAINAYIKNLPFDGVLSLSALVDAVQAAQGVVDPKLVSAEAKYGDLTYANIDREYTANAGHMKIDDDYPLSATITYV